MERAERIEFNGHTYRLSGNYYRRHNWSSPGPSNLHRAVWEFHNGPVPEGYDVHHKDGDSFNNDIANLEVAPESEHHRSHMLKAERVEQSRSVLDSVRHLAAAWHKSAAAKPVQRRAGMASWENRQSVSVECVVCGKKFETCFPSRTYLCSGACASARRRRSGKDNEKRRCVACGMEFEVGRYTKTRTCSKRCASVLLSLSRRGIQPDSRRGSLLLREWVVGVKL